MASKSTSTSSSKKKEDGNKTPRPSALNVLWTHVLAQYWFLPRVRNYAAAGCITAEEYAEAFRLDMMNDFGINFTIKPTKMKEWMSDAGIQLESKHTVIAKFPDAS